MAEGLTEGMPLVDIALAQAITYTEELEGAGLVVDKTISFKTADEAEVEPEVSEGEENILRVKNQILAINRTEDIVIGYNLTLKNNELILEMLQLVDGGEFKYDSGESTKVIGYIAPKPGVVVERKPFDLVLYSAEKDTGGDVVGYAKFTFKNTKGTPVKYSLKDGEFFVPEMELKSRPKPSQVPVEIDFVDKLPL